ncbi:TetR family transcriptional regulator C-terminal domain-containing protein [Streptomyces sp. NPDC051561]|uniref:TetR family transcriptional regulator C-terminal domain-containing protein n=1 Tax=Streptomyces sp. NPDC051561 TaxID=3365658 RepID=UPI003792EDA4
MLRMMSASLPLTAELHAELRVWLSFVQASLTDAGMAAVHRDATVRLLRGVEEALRGAQRAGELATDVDVEAEAAALVAFVDGLCLHYAATGDGFDASRISTALSGCVDRLFDR